jgi:DNA-binding MarR family transcriptional regulator
MTTDATGVTATTHVPAPVAGPAEASPGEQGARPASPLAETASRLRLVIGRLSRWSRQHGPVALTAGQHSALATVADQGPLRLTTLASLEGVSPPAATRVVDGLAGRGLVVREADESDARCNLVALSQEGKELLHEMRTSREALLARQLAQLSPDEILAVERALPVLERIVRIPVIPRIGKEPDRSRSSLP